MRIWGQMPLAEDWYQATPAFQKGAGVMPPSSVFRGAKCTLAEVRGPYAVLRVGAHSKQPLRYYLIKAKGLDGAYFVPAQIRVVEPGTKRKPVTELIAECEALARAEVRSLYPAEKKQLQSLLKVCGPHALLQAVGEVLIGAGHVSRKKQKSLEAVLRGE